MTISHYGLGMVKVAQGDTTVCFNPIGKIAEGDLKPVKFGADIALISLHDPNFNGAENVSRGERVPFVVDSPGEYEIGGIFIRGFASVGPEGRSNTIYSLTLEGVNLVHLGALAKAELSAETIENLGAIDVLFVPVALAKIIAELEPKIIVPVNFANEAALKNFLRETGTKNEKPIDNLTVKRKDLLEKESEVIIIKSW